MTDYTFTSKPSVMKTLAGILGVSQSTSGKPSFDTCQGHKQPNAKTKHLGKQKLLRLTAMAFAKRTLPVIWIRNMK